MSEQVKLLRAALKNNRPALLLGPAGTAKTATVNALSEELGYPVHVMLLAGILPEDLGGLVRPTQDGAAFGYLPPAWARQYGDKPFVLFLDEINQAAIQTLHALFYIVNDRTVAGIRLPNMRIVAAGNTADENEFLTPLPTPLLDRFVYKIKWRADLMAALSWLGEKYIHMGGRAEMLISAVRETHTEEITPRHVEQMLMLIEDGTDDIERGRELVGAAYEAYMKLLSAGKRHKEDNRLAELREIAKKLKSADEFAVIDGKMTRIDRKAILAGLSPEEIDLVNAA